MKLQTTNFGCSV